MGLPRIATRDEWTAARTELLAEEKELTKRRDALGEPVARSEQRFVLVPAQRDYRLVPAVRAQAAAGAGSKARRAIDTTSSGERSADTRTCTGVSPALTLNIA